ncbi:MAG: hypothetical protein OXF24_04180 [Hyphomicrobiales bacterium]|nr:hypothetical protein [Hyphomicrobiales bacterium]
MTEKDYEEKNRKIKISVDDVKIDLEIDVEKSAEEKDKDFISRIERKGADEERIIFETRHERFSYILLVLCYIDFQLYDYFTANFIPQLTIIIVSVILFLEYMLLVTLAVLWDMRIVLFYLLFGIRFLKSWIKWL